MSDTVRIDAELKQRAERVNATRVLRGEKRVPLSEVAAMGFRQWLAEEEARLGIGPKEGEGQDGRLDT